MTDKERYDDFASALMRRFDELVHWAMVNWPNDKFPLMESDFTESRREISQILGPKLGDPEPARSSSGRGEKGSRYLDVAPAPWP